MAGTLGVALATSEANSDRIFLGLFSAMLVFAITGLLLLVLWLRARRQSGRLLQQIKDRMPPPGVPETDTDYRA